MRLLVLLSVLLLAGCMTAPGTGAPPAMTPSASPFMSGGNGGAAGGY